MGRLIHLVADHGPGDLVHAQLVQQLLLALPGASVLPTRVDEGDTVAAGFCVAQLALSEGPDDRIVLHDVASATAAGELLYGAHTRAGVVVIGPNTGWSWSFIAGEVLALCELDVCVDAASRAGLARAVSHVARRHPHAICEVLEDPPIPAVPERAVAYVDGDGNVETTIAEPPAAVGAAVMVRIGDVSAQARVAADRDRTVAAGELAIATGPAGWPTRAGGRRTFVELFVGGGSAADRFARPRGGSEIGFADQPANAGGPPARRSVSAARRRESPRRS
jgi:hypothetical protein